MGIQDYADHPKMKPSVVLSGSAEEGKNGTAIGLIDIGASENAFLFRVALPSIRNDLNKIRCEIDQEGKVVIHATATESTGLLQQLSRPYQMRVQQLYSPGPFTVSFNLPGPVDPRLFAPRFRTDGILEGVIMKYRRPNDPANDSAAAWVPPP